MDSNNKSNISDDDLVSECIAGKEWAWEIFYERFFRLVISKVYRIKKTYTYNFTEEDIEECIQQVWVSFLDKDCDKLVRWGKGCKLSNWISVCTGNAVINFFNSIIRKNLYQDELDKNISSLPIHSTKTPLDSVIEASDVISCPVPPEKTYTRPESVGLVPGSSRYAPTATSPNPSPSTSGRPATSIPNWP